MAFCFPLEHKRLEECEGMKNRNTFQNEHFQFSNLVNIPILQWKNHSGFFLPYWVLPSLTENKSRNSVVSNSA
jgi:hypothetical protein